MKTISLILVSSVMATSVLAQTQSTVTINVRGNNTEAIIIDGKEFLVNSDGNTNANTPIVVSSLQAGQHSLQIKRFDNVNPESTVFTIRTGFDLQITITANGSVQQRETKWRSDTTPYTVAMSDADFNTLFNNVRSQWRNANKVRLISEAFSNTSNYFTTSQAKQLIQLVNNQGDRFTMAKASYRSISDPVNFPQMYDMFNSQSYRDQLADYVSSYSAGSSSTAMTASSFNTIYRTAQRQATTNSKVSYIYNTFSNTNNYFTVSQARQLVQLVSGDANRLYLAKISYRSVIDRNNFSQMNNLLSDQSSRNDLATFISTYDGNSPVYTKVAMKDADFNVLYRDIQNRFGLGVKMQALRDVFNNETYYFTTAQAKQLIQLVSSESNRLELAKSSYGNIVDPTNFSQLYDVLSSTSSRNELDVYVRNDQGTTSGSTPVITRTPMSNTAFTTMYNDVRSTWGLGAKMSELTDIFNNENNYFTVAQARQLIQLVSAESNRLQLAKSSYGNITDPENFTMMYEILSSQSSRNELSTYVNSYSYNR